MSDGLKANGEEPEGLNGTLTLSKYGERMRLSIYLPKYDFDPGDKHPLRLHGPVVFSRHEHKKPSTARGQAGQDKPGVRPSSRRDRRNMPPDERVY